MVFLNAHTHFSRHPETEILQIEPGAESPNFYSTGVHPWQSERFTIDQLRISENCLAIGEAGLDRLKGPDLSVQIPAFEAQVQLAEQLRLPLIIHCVKAWNELQQVYRQTQPEQAWIYHGFMQSGIVEQVVNEGIIISIGTGILTHPRADYIIRCIPDDQLLLETDDRETDIQEVYEAVAALKKISLQELEGIILTNFQQIFKKWHIG